MILHSEKSYKTCVIFAWVISKNVIYFDHKITKLEKRLTPFRHISSILSLSLSGLSIPITPTISRKPSVLTDTRFSSFYRRTDAPADTFIAVSRYRNIGGNRIVSHTGKLCYISAKLCLHPVGNGLAHSACDGLGRNLCYLVGASIARPNGRNYD